MKKLIPILVLHVCCSLLLAQHTIDIDVTLVPERGWINLQQKVVYTNTSKETLKEIYFNDWANSFSSKTTPLARRFAENYDSSIHFEKDENRGFTTIFSITSGDHEPLEWLRGDEADILKVKLDTPLAPGDSYTLKFLYRIKLPSDRFTRFGMTDNRDFKLRYWYLSPAVYDGIWHAYSNKNIDDLYLTPSTFHITLHTPPTYAVTSSLDVVSEEVANGSRTTVLQGNDRMQVPLYLEQQLSFETIATEQVEVVTNLTDKKVGPPIRAVIVDRVVRYLEEKLGPYPFEKIISSESNYKSNPVYGLNQLPNFISPFPDGFEYDLEQLKTISREYLETTLPLNPRNDSWLIGAIQIYLMMDYVDTYYPKMKIIGDLSDFWVIRWSHASELEFNDQYPLLYLNMARNNIHQELTTPRDKLLKFNKNIANDYLGGVGLQYIREYIGTDAFEESLRYFYSTWKLKPLHSTYLKGSLKKYTDLPLDWFFDSYITTRDNFDFKIRKVRKQGDSLEVTIRNLKKSAMPVPLYGLSKDTIVYKEWVAPVDSIATVTIPARDIRKLAVNYEAIIPEYNQRNNFKKVKGLLNRPLQFRLFQDVEDPNYNQLFFMPVFEYNLYDGFTLGPKLYNKTVLPKGIHYKLEPQYGFRSNTIVGNGSIVYTQQTRDEQLYAMRYGISGSYFSYDRGLFYKRLSPFMTFAFRNEDLRRNERQFINIRNINVSRDDNPSDPNQEPDYSVYNLQYVYSNPNLINYFRGVLDYQIATKFSKLSATLEYRKLFLNNRQLNLRFFAGVFLYNDTPQDDDYFSFALDRPTDYLFDYNYYGRSEDSGLFSQQLIIAEGGFKSKLEPAFSNSWMTTLNASTNIWKWIYAYGDAGLVHNVDEGVKFVYDSGIRLSLVADYFELYFPLYSNLGWEPDLSGYDEKVRFIITLSPKTLLGLFTREWY